MSPGSPSAPWFLSGRYPWLSPCSLDATPSLSLLHRIAHDIAATNSADVCAAVLAVMEDVVQRRVGPWVPAVLEVEAFAKSSPKFAAQWFSRLISSPDLPVVLITTIGLRLLRGIAAGSLAGSAAVPLRDQLTLTWWYAAGRIGPLERLPPHLGAYALVKCLEGGNKAEVSRALSVDNQSWAQAVARALWKLGVYGWVVMPALTAEALARLPATWWYLQEVLLGGEDVDPANYHIPGSMSKIIRHWKWDGEAPDVCSVCYDDQQIEPWVQLPCGHSAHAGCMYDWACKRAGGYTCPYCAVEIGARARLVEEGPGFEMGDFLEATIFEVEGLEEDLGTLEADMHLVFFMRSVTIL